MTNQNKLPATVTARNVAVPTEQSRNLVSRGLEDIESRAIEAIAELSPDVAELLEDAKQGDADAQYYLGWAYREGRGVSANIVKAHKWWLEAALHGHIDAQIELGCCYSKGEGVPEDYVQAYKWFDLACWAGILGETRALRTPPAFQMRDSIGELLTLNQITEARKLAVEIAENYMTREEMSEAIALDDRDRAPT